MRVFLHGEGDPIPIQALPDELPISDRPPLSFLLDGSAPFPVEEYRVLGYTNFEVVCIGAAGGRGGGSAALSGWTTTTVQQGVSASDWELVRERASLADYLVQASMYHSPPTVIPGDASGVSPTGPWRDYAVPPALNRVYKPNKYAVYVPDALNWVTNPTDDNVDPTLLRWINLMQEFGYGVMDGNAYNPNNYIAKTYLELFDIKYSATRNLTFRILSSPVLGTTPIDIGGAGGGGGLHKVGGLLSELPSEVPVVVGVAGADAPLGQVNQNGVWTPTLADAPFTSASVPGPFISGLPYIGGAEYAYYRNRIAEIEAYLRTLLVTYPEPHPSFYNPVKGEDGGASSFGDICQASGGVGGGESVGWPGGVKTFLGYGAQGGSGGRVEAGGGGAGSTASGIPGADGTWDGIVGKGGGGGLSGKSASPIRAASTGGRGSYSFSDPSVYGPRQGKSGLIPGGGGGALLLPGPPPQYYGSDAVASNPNGAVYLRLTKID